MIKDEVSIGDVVYFVSSSIFVRKATIISIAGGFCTIKFEDTRGGTRVRLSKIYKTEAEANKVANRNLEEQKRNYQ